MNIQKGTEAAQSGDFHAAINFFTLSLNEDDNNVSVLVMRALAYSELEEYGKALADTYKALSIDAAMPDAYSAKALIEWRNGDLNAALVDYDKALAIQPDSISIMNRGQVKRDTGDLSGAISDLQEATRLDPDNKLAHQILMICKSFTPEVYKMYMAQKA